MSSVLSVPLSLPDTQSGTGRSEASPVAPAGIAQWLFAAAQQYPHAGLHWLVPAGRHGDEAHPAERFLSYSALLDEALHILGGLRAQPLAGGANVALLLEHASDFIPAFWGCVLGGYVPCPLIAIRNDRERWTKHLAYLHTLLEAPLVITTSALRGEMSDLAAVDLQALRAGPRAAPQLHASPEQAAVLVLTSGSTGHSKAVVLTHGNLFASMAGKNQYQQLSAADITLNWISFDHVAALLEAHLLPLYAGATQLHIDSAAILTDPLLFLRLIDRHRVSMTFAPNFLLGQITAQLSSPTTAPLALDLSCLRHIISGGEANLVATGRRFLEQLAPWGLTRSVLWPAFGMTETCAGSIYSRAFPEGDAGQEFAALGTPVSGLQTRIVDSSDEPVSAGQTGELQLRGPMIFTHYYNNEAATGAAFTADGWFRTGDLGRIDAGTLRLVGRSKDSIIVSGVNYFSHELETALALLKDIEYSFVAAFATRPAGADTEQLVVAFTPSFVPDLTADSSLLLLSAEARARLKQLLTAIRNTTLLLWGFRPLLILALPKKSFPKTNLGKIQRTMLRQRLESGAYAAAVEQMAQLVQVEYQPPQGAAETRIAAIFAQICASDPAAVSATASFFDLGGSSLDIVRLKQRMQKDFSLPGLSIVTILQNPSVRGLATHIASASTTATTIDPQLHRPVAAVGSSDSSADARVRQPAHSGRLAPPYDPVVPLQVSGSKTPLFCVHAGSGEVLVFLNLARYFANERPFYALRARGFVPGERYFASFDEMVQEYVTAIRQRQPHGPYALAGYSYGGPVAFEIAKALEIAGQRVAFLGSIDGTPTIGNFMARFDRVDSAVVLAFFLSLIDRQQLYSLPGELRELGSASFESVCAALVERAPPARLEALDMDIKRFTAWAELSHALVQLGEEYTPAGTVDSLSVFYAQPLAGPKEEWLQQRLHSWNRFVRTPVRYIEVAGEHHTLFEARYIASFQSLLRAEIDRALDGR
jgi:acyl-CoA synthetase (AMP-forming)/AMP-acid ligase II/thioesterase domain-containing protein/acyl carrier protein